MIRIRFHGRGGHGVKTASRIVGTAAFLAGYQAQDSPVYGAERRGAAVVAFTRISGEPILERGMIASPDLIVIADETLLDDPAAAVLAGQESASAVFVNARPDRREAFFEKCSLTPQLITFDVTGRTIEFLEKASSLSAGIGAAAARLVGLISEDCLLEALFEEFEHLRIPPDEIDKNVQVARQTFAALPVCLVPKLEIGNETHLLSPLLEKGRIEEGAEQVTVLAYADPVRGSPSILDAGNAEQRNTGSWRVERPLIDRELCTRCGLCFVMCPDGAISLDEDGYPTIDYDHCKGCMICRQLCPIEAIEHEKETRAW